MHPLYSPQKYPADVAQQIRQMPPLATEIANRWMLGWPKRVKALLEAGQYLDALKAQEKSEREALSSPGMNHLAQHEKAEVMGLDPAPPTL